MNNIVIAACILLLVMLFFKELDVKINRHNELD